MVSVNSDMGEAFGLHSFGNDPELVTLIDTANVACGFHAGDPTVLRETVELALGAGVTVGAHPGLPDLVGFGRREMKLDRGETADLVRYQVGALVAFLRAHEAPLDHLKPHGSLYGMAARQEEIADAICDVAVDYEVPIYGMAGTLHEFVAARRGVPFVSEVYVDLTYRADGSLIIARRPSATPPELATARARLALAEQVVECDTGERVSVRPDSICVHSDTPNAPEVARAVRAVVEELAELGG